MSVQEKEHFFGVYKTLSADEKEVCFDFCMTDWQPGIGENYFEFIKSNKDILKDLINKGVIEKSSSRILAQEWINENSEAINEVIKKGAAGTEEERAVLTNYRLKVESVMARVDEPRYRLARDFRDYVRDRLSKAL